MVKKKNALGSVLAVILLGIVAVLIVLWLVQKFT